MAAAPSNVQRLPVRPRSASRRPASECFTSDNDMLLAAIACRLSGGVDNAPEAPAALRGLVHDCAQAMEQLRSGLAQERNHAERVERELREMRTALAAARLELAGTRDGERRALHLADHDALTALPNRNCFQNRLAQALGSSAGMRGKAGPTHGTNGTNGTDATNGANAAAAGASLAVLFLDLDDFKPINDRYGHQTGDELLRIVAQRLSRAVRAGDMVCRLGGDEFACLLSSPMGHEQLSHVAAKLFDAISAPLTVGPLELTVRPSIGIAVCPDDGNTAAALLQRADTAMYRAKRRQLGYSFFDSRVDA